MTYSVLPGQRWLSRSRRFRFWRRGHRRSRSASIGAGREGSALGTLFAKAGHQVMFSSRHPEDLKSLVEGIGPGAKAGTVEQAIAFADVVAIVVPYTRDASRSARITAALASKPLVIDVSNPIARRDGEDLVKWVDRAGRRRARHRENAARSAISFAPSTRSAMSKLTADAHRPGEPVGVPIAGDDQNAIAIASSLIKEIGFEPVLVGGLAMGKYLVPGTPLGGEHTPAEIKQIAAKLH